MADSPYAGLNPYTVRDAPFFFGREHERDLIVANVMASRLTVLYGPSGVGKSSVLNAGALTALRGAYRRLAPDGRPQVIAAVFQGWQSSPATDLVRSLEGQIGFASDGPLIDRLAAWTRGREGRLLLLLDQFEEYLLYHERADDEFGEVLPIILTRPFLPVNVLISIREDAVARLDIFKGRVPGLFQNYLRLDRLSREAARDAIIGPLERFNELGLSRDRPVSIEPALVETVLNDVRAGQLTIGETGRGRVAGTAGVSTQRIETPYLQLVMKRLWEAERARNSETLRLDTYARLGGAQRIVEGHLDETVRALSWREQAAAAAMFEHLVTPTKSKIAHTGTDLASYAQVNPARISALLEKLSGPDRILATVAPAADQSPESRYQIFHDVLASAVLAWTAKYRARRQLRRRMAQAVAVVMIVAALISLVLLSLRTSRQARLIDALQANSRDIGELMRLQGELHELAGQNQTIETQVAGLEQIARDAKATQLAAQLSDVRKGVEALGAKNRTLAEQTTRVGTSLENNQRRIEQIQGVANAVPQTPVEPPVHEPNADTPTPPPRPAETRPRPTETATARSAAEAGVLATLQRYTDAYNSLQADRVASVFPSFAHLKELATSFHDLRAYHLVVTPTGPVQFSDDLSSATVTCRVSGTFEPKAGSRGEIKPQTKVFYLRQSGSDWIVSRTDP